MGEGNDGVDRIALSCVSGSDVGLNHSAGRQTEP